MMKKSNLILMLPILLLLYGLILAACGNGGSTSTHGEHSDIHGDEKWEVTNSYTVPPIFVSDFSANTQRLYKLVHKYKEILVNMNCYCGCMEYEVNPHNSLYRCFIAKEDVNSIVWTNHGALCGTCMQELDTVDKMVKQGKSQSEIKKSLDDTFKV